MSSCPELLDRLQPEEHVVQLYGNDDRLLILNVGRFLSEGLKRGDGLLVIATPEHRTSLTRLLREDRAYPKAVLEGRLVFLDAEPTLGRFMVNGAPDPKLFRSVVGETLEGVSGRAVHSGVRAYGEMVGLLWKAGNHAAAANLEELWNELLKQSNVSLFCAYPIDIFGAEFQSERVDRVLCSHTHLLPFDGALESAMTRAMEEVLGPELDHIPGLIQANHQPTWGEVPRAEALVLWLRSNVPASADEITARAREYYQPLAAPRS